MKLAQEQRANSVRDGDGETSSGASLRFSFRLERGQVEPHVGGTALRSLQSQRDVSPEKRDAEGIPREVPGPARSEEAGNSVQ